MIRQSIFIFIFIFILSLLITNIYAQDLARRIELGFRIKSLPTKAEPGVVIQSVVPGYPAEKAGLRVGDRIMVLNGIRMDSSIAYYNAKKSIKAITPVEIDYLRQYDRIKVDVSFTETPVEEIENCDVILSQVKNSAGQNVRMIITKPKGKTGKLPVILFIPWLSCLSVEVPPTDRTFAAMRSLHGVASRSGMIMVRVDKPGLSDSEGACKECDYLTEISAYKNALEQIRKLPYVDANSIYVMGESLGGATAALVARGQKIKGLIAVSTVARPWYDHMMANERRRLALMGKSKEEIEQYAKRSDEFYAHYLKDKMSPPDIIAKKPHMKDIWDDEPYHQYGRPIAFYQQLQDQDIRGAFQSIKVPTLVIWGQYDWIMAKEDSEWIANSINKNKKGLATLEIVPQMEHSQGLYNNANDAFNETNRTGLAKVDEVVLNWLFKQK